MDKPTTDSETNSLAQNYADSIRNKDKKLETVSSSLQIPGNS